MAVPPWLTLLVAGTVIAFGLYRLRLALRSDEEDERARRRKGLYAMPRRRHALFGLVYLLMGGILIAGMLGYSLNPFHLLAPQQEPQTQTPGIEVTPQTGAE